MSVFEFSCKRVYADQEPIYIADDFNPCVAEMASVSDGEILHTEPALDGDFYDLQSLADECVPLSILVESAELCNGENMNADAQHEDDFS